MIRDIAHATSGSPLAGTSQRNSSASKTFRPSRDGSSYAGARPWASQPCSRAKPMHSERESISTSTDPPNFLPAVSITTAVLYSGSSLVPPKRCRQYCASRNARSAAGRVASKSIVFRGAIRRRAARPAAASTTTSSSARPRSGGGRAGPRLSARRQ